MAIAFARARYLSRASGGNAVRSAAYNAREAIEAARTGEVFHFRHRDAPDHHEVLLPEGADAKFADCAVLWNAAEAAEKRKDAQVAREIVLALPADEGLTREDRIELARSFAEQHFVSKGLAVQLDVHVPHKDRGEGEGDVAEGTGGDHGNWHAHLLITTRRIEGDRLAAKKARDLEPAVRTAGNRPLVTEAAVWGEVWRAHQDRYFAEHGLDLRVDATAVHPGEHIGPVRMRKAGSPAVARAEVLRSANENAARDPEQVLAALTRNNATFTERDLDRYLAKHLGGTDETPSAETARQMASVRAAVLEHRQVLALHDRDTGEAAERFTTRTVRVEERTALADGATVAGARHHRDIAPRHQNAALANRTLRADQQAAFNHAVGAGGLKLIEGRAGTGKSFTLATVRAAHEQAGYRVVGLAPTNAVAQDLKTDGFGEAGTVHAALFRLKNGRSLGWDKRTVLMVDEAAMLDTRVTGELLAEAKGAGAKVILAGDDRQLASIERGGLFTELRQAHGSATLIEVTRQRVDWQRQAARDLAEGQFDAAVAAFDHHGAVTWRPDQDGSRTALVERWKADTAQDPKASRFVFAYTNEEVDRLNTALRQVRRERGELGSGDVTLATKHGPAAFAVGDRVQFTDTAKKLGIYNGTVGTLIGLDARTGEVAVRLDAPTGKAGRIVSWSAADGFEGFRHGYAGTIYKGQGKTLDHTYLLHTQHWRAAASYVALTRQRESAQLFVATETARDARQLAWQMARGEVRAASVAWATADELHPSQQSSPEEAGKAKATAASNTPVAPAPERNATGDDRRQAARREARQNKTGDTTAASRPRQVAGHGLSADQWLIAPRVSPDGRDSLGRGLDGGSVRAVVVADPGVQREREALMDYLRGGYRDPLAARARLDELVKREGFASAAARIANVPEQLGELRGTTGFFAGSAARQERVVALRVASAVPGSLSRIGEAERAAAERYRQSVQAQLAADATGIPRLSAQAEAAVNAVAAEKDDAGRLAAWKVVQGDASLRAELQAFRAAVEQRFRADGVRAMLRAEGRPGAVQLPGVREQAAVNRVSLLVGILRQGDRVAERQAATERATARQGQRPHLRP